MTNVSINPLAQPSELPMYKC